MRNLLLVIITFFTLNSIAQEKTTTVKQDKAKSLAKVKTKKLTEQLDLSAEQQKNVYIIMYKHFKEELQTKQKIKLMVESKDKTKKAEIKKAIATHKQSSSEKLNNQLQEILTEKQYKSYIETLKQHLKAKQKTKTVKN